MSIDALDDFKSAGRGSKNPYEVESKSLSTGAVATMMQEDIDHICGILGVEVRLNSRCDLSLVPSSIALLGFRFCLSLHLTLLVPLR